MIKILKKYIWYVIYILTIIFIAYNFKNYINILGLILTSQRKYYLILAFLTNFLAFIVMSLNWTFIVKRYHTASTIELMKSFYISQLTRYVPGNIWSFLIRFKENSKLNITKSTTAYLLGVENIFLLFTAFIFSFFIILIFKSSIYSNVVYIIFALSLIFFILFYGKLYRKGVSLFIKKFKTNVEYKELKNHQLFTVFFFFCIYWVLFGISFYFTYLMLADYPINLFLAIGINAAAWLIGYLSLLTPSGLGVREAAFVGFLTRFIDKTTALNIAVIARFNFLLTEFAGFLFVYLLVFLISKKYALLRFIKKHKFKLILGLLILTYFIFFSALGIAKYNNLRAGRYDLGNMNQVVWNSLNGHFFMMQNPDNDTIVSRMSIHSDILLVGIVPFYIIYSSPITLIVLQTFVLALGGVGIYLIAKRKINNEIVSLIFTSCYLLYPALEQTNAFDFHMVSFSITFFIFAFLYIERKQYLISLVLCLLAVLTKEEIGLVVFLLGLYIAIFRKEYKWGSVFSLIGLLSTYLFVWILIPNARVGSSAHFAIGYYSNYGDSPGDIVKNVVTNPIKLITNSFNSVTWIYFSLLLVPLGLLSLFSPFILLIASSELGINILSNDTHMRSIYYQYNSAIIPFIFISAIFGFKFIMSKYNGFYDLHLKRYLKLKLIHILAIYILITSLIFNYFFGIWIWSSGNPYNSFYPVEGAFQIQKLEHLIPSNYSVSSTNAIGSHFTNRLYTYNFPVKINEVDFIFISTVDTSLSVDKKTLRVIVESLKKNNKYILEYDKNNLYLFQRKDLKGINIDYKDL